MGFYYFNTITLICNCPQTQQSEDKKGPATQKSVQRQELPASATTVQELAEPQKSPENWSYHDIPDKMGRGTIKMAYTDSINTISFSFPYEGPQHGTLKLRSHPQYGKDVMLSIKRGQFLTGVDGCKVLVRFDSGKPQSFWGRGPADYSTDTLFLSNYSKFVAGLKRSKKVMIETTIFNEGDRVFEFNVEGLQWETASSRKKK